MTNIMKGGCDKRQTYYMQCPEKTSFMDSHEGVPSRPDSSCFSESKNDTHFWTLPAAMSESSKRPFGYE